MFDIDQKVMVHNMRPGPAWISGVIIQKLGPTSYLVAVPEAMKMPRGSAQGVDGLTGHSTEGGTTTIRTY